MRECERTQTEVAEILNTTRRTIDGIERRALAKIRNNPAVYELLFGYWQASESRGERHEQLLFTHLDEL